MLIKICSSAIHPSEIRYASKSKPGHTYVVVTETLFNDDFCTCPGWKFREHCAHIDDARSRSCKWWARPEDGEFKKCPLCGGPVEDFEMDAEWD